MWATLRPWGGALAWAIDRTSALLATLTRWLVIAAGGGMITALVLQILFRYGVGRALVWSEELALFLFTWSTLLAASLGVREGFHVRLTLAIDGLPHPWRTGLERLLWLVVALFGAALAITGYRYVDATLGQLSAAVRYPVEALHAAAPVAGGLIALHALARALKHPLEPPP
ncbi:MAG: TRAP transporter small permease [Candidatus Competibacterales bacterium]